MIKHMKFRKAISTFLSLCVIMSMFTVAAYADNNSASSSTATVTSAPGGTPPTGTPPSGSPPTGTPSSGAPGGNSGMNITALENTNTSANFTDLDVSTSWANAYIDYLYTNGIVKGTSDGIYSPNSTLKRCDFALMLYRKYNYSTEGFSYGDVPTNAYYYQAVMRGKASKVFEDSKYFNPDEAVTREQAAVWMYNSEVNKGMPKEMSTSEVSSYNDSASISESARTAVATMTKLGIFKGDESGNFNPQASLTRAEMAVAFYRLSFLGGGGQSSGQGGSQNGAPGGAPGASATVDHGTYSNKADADATGVTYESTKDTENAVRVQDGAKVTLSNITINKLSGAAGTGDTSNFYGGNAGLLAMDKANVTINKATVNTTANGANGIFSYGEGTTVTVNDSTIRTTQNSSGGIMVTGGGTMYVNNCDIETQGGSSAALRTDRGGGTLVVNGGKYVSNGNGSPAIYCTADITVSDATLNATTSEAVVVEGKNSVTLKNCNVSGKMIKDNVQNIQNVMIYQSMSGDAATGKSSFVMEGGSLTGYTGDMFYVTNTSCIVKLKGVKLTPATDVLLKVAGNDARNGWGVVGKNGGQCEFTADNQEMNGKIIVDNISTLDFSLTNESNFNGTINSSNEGGTVNVNIDSTSKWTLTGDVYLTGLTGITDNIITNGYKVYVNGTAVK